MPQTSLCDLEPVESLEPFAFLRGTLAFLGPKSGLALRGPKPGDGIFRQPRLVCPPARASMGSSPLEVPAVFSQKPVDLALGFHFGPRSRPRISAGTLCICVKRAHTCPATNKNMSSGICQAPFGVQLLVPVEIPGSITTGNMPHRFLAFANRRT